MATDDCPSPVDDVICLRLQLDVPYHSAADVVAEIGELCDRAEEAAPPRPVMLELVGPGPGSAPLGGWAEEVDVGLVNKWERAVRRLERLGVPTITVVSGECSGESLDLLLATDYRIGAPDVRLSLARTEGLLWPGMALHRLVQQVGLATARRMALFGRRLDAPEALALGLLDEVTDDPAASVAAAAARAAELTGTEVAVRRRLLLEAAVSSHEEALGVHLSAVDRTLRQSRADEDEEDR